MFSIRFLEPISTFWGVLLTPTSNSLDSSWVFYNSTQYWHFLCGNSIWIHRLKVQSPRIIAKSNGLRTEESLVQFIVQKQESTNVLALKAGRKKKRWIIPFLSFISFYLSVSWMMFSIMREDLLLSPQIQILISFRNTPLNRPRNNI